MRTFLGNIGRTVAWAVVLYAPIAVAQEYPMHARVSFDAGSSMVKGSSDADWSHATVNTLILPGDTLWVDKGGSTELEMAGGAFLRLADGSKAEVVSLPPNATIRGWGGSFYVQRISRSTGTFIFTTPACAVELESDTCARVDIVDQGATTVSVRWGRAAIRTDAGGATTVLEGQQCWIDPGFLPSETRPFDRTLEDAFDQWNRDRSRLLAEGIKTVPKTVVIQESTLGASDLSGCGEWVYAEDNYYWRPTVVVDYVPYRTGYWSYVPGVGSVWVENYPFSYVTSHYGRWHYSHSYGWLWSYNPVWSPAWVATIRCGDYFVWTPVDYHCRPVLVTQSAFFNVGGVQFCVSAASYAPASCVYSNPFGVYPIYDDVVHYIGMHPTQINIWNINIGHEPRVRVPYDHSVTMVRDYNPPRSIRGPESLSQGGRMARESVTDLERSVGRAQFASIDRTGGRGERTISSDQGRSARMRSVRMDSKTVTAPAEPITRMQERPSRPDSAAPETRGNLPSLVRTSEPGRDGRATRSGNTQGNREPVAPHASVRGSGRPGTTPDKTESRNTRTSVPTRRDVEPGGGPAFRGSRTDDSSIQRRSSVRTVPDTSVRTAPQTSGDSPRTSTPVRETPTHSRVVNTSRHSDSGGKAPQSNVESMPAPSRGTVRSYSGGMPSPSRSVVRSTPQSAPQSMPAPSRSIVRSAPESMPESRPSRSIERSAPEPSPRIDYNPAPSRSMEAPSRNESRAPQRFEAPSAPEPRPSRSISAPEPSRSISAPEPNRSISAPSTNRSINSDSRESGSHSVRGSGRR